MLIGLLIALVAMVLNSAGALLQADGSRRATRTRPVAVQPRFLAGIVVDLIAWLCAAIALRALPVFAVQAVIGGSIALTAIAGARMNERKLSRNSKLAVGACLVGLVLVAASAGTDRQPIKSETVNVVLIAALLVLAVAVLVLRQFSRAWPLAMAAGMGFGGSSLAVRAAHVEVGNGFSITALLGQPTTYLVLGFWVVGMIGYSASLTRGDVGSVTAVFVVTEVVLPGIVGIVLLGDPVREGFVWPFVLGLLVAVAGVVVLARTPPPRRPRVR